MRVIIVFIGLFCALCLNSCTKLSEKDRVAFGQIVDSVNSPIANVEFALMTVKYDNSLSASNGYQYVTEYKFISDANGNFRVTFKAKKSEDICIAYPGMSPEKGEYYWSKDAGKQIEFNVGVLKMPRR